MSDFYIRNCCSRFHVLANLKVESPILFARYVTTFKCKQVVGHLETLDVCLRGKTAEQIQLESDHITHLSPHVPAAYLKSVSVALFCF